MTSINVGPPVVQGLHDFSDGPLNFSLNQDSDGKRHELTPSPDEAYFTSIAKREPSPSHTAYWTPHGYSRHPPMSHPPMSHPPMSHPPMSHPPMSHPPMSHLDGLQAVSVQPAINPGYAHHGHLYQNDHKSMYNLHHHHHPQPQPQPQHQQFHQRPPEVHQQPTPPPREEKVLSPKDQQKPLRRNRERASYTRYQLEILNHIYRTVRYPNASQKHVLAQRLGIKREQVKIWFQNRRRKDILSKKNTGNTTQVIDQSRSEEPGSVVPFDIKTGMLQELMEFQDESSVPGQPSVLKNPDPPKESVDIAHHIRHSPVSAMGSKENQTTPDINLCSPVSNAQINQYQSLAGNYGISYNQTVMTRHVHREASPASHSPDMPSSPLDCHKPRNKIDFTDISKLSNAMPTSLSASLPSESENSNQSHCSEVSRGNHSEHADLSGDSSYNTRNLYQNETATVCAKNVEYPLGGDNASDHGSGSASPALSHTSDNRSISSPVSEVDQSITNRPALKGSAILQDEQNKTSDSLGRDVPLSNMTLFNQTGHLSPYGHPGFPHYVPTSPFMGPFYGGYPQNFSPEMINFLFAQQAGPYSTIPSPYRPQKFIHEAPPLDMAPDAKRQRRQTDPRDIQNLPSRAEPPMMMASASMFNNSPYQMEMHPVVSSSNPFYIERSQPEPTHQIRELN